MMITAIAAFALQALWPTIAGIGVGVAGLLVRSVRKKNAREIFDDAVAGAVAYVEANWRRELGNVLSTADVASLQIKAMRRLYSALGGQNKVARMVRKFGVGDPEIFVSDAIERAVAKVTSKKR